MTPLQRMIEMAAAENGAARNHDDGTDCGRLSTIGRPVKPDTKKRHNRIIEMRRSGVPHAVISEALGITPRSSRTLFSRASRGLI